MNYFQSSKMSLLNIGLSVVVRASLKRHIFSASSYPYQRCLSSKPVNADEKEVYYGALAPQIKGVKMFSLMTSIAGIIAQPVLYQQVVTMGGGMPMTVALGSFVGFFTFVTPFLLHTITKKYVTKIIYREKDDTYTATTITFFLQPSHLTFRPEDVVVPDIPRMFTSFHAKGKPLLIDSRLFSDVNHYARIMGFDKPIDFKFEDDIKESDPKPPKK